MVAEPRFRKVPLGLRDAKNPAQGRWGYYYSEIADYMLRHPGSKADEIAAYVKRHPQTVRNIIKTDLFQEFLAQRKEEWRAAHDFALLHKTTMVAEKALDVMLEKLDKQGDKIPTALVNEIATNALDRLGYAPKTTPQVSVSVDNSQTSNRVVMVPITAAALEEARDAIRAAEANRMIEARASEPDLEAEQLDGPDGPSGEDRGGDSDSS